MPIPQVDENKKNLTHHFHKHYILKQTCIDAILMLLEFPPLKKITLLPTRWIQFPIKGWGIHCYANVIFPSRQLRCWVTLAKAAVMICAKILIKLKVLVIRFNWEWFTVVDRLLSLYCRGKWGESTKKESILLRVHAKSFLILTIFSDYLQAKYPMQFASCLIKQIHFKRLM